MIPTSESRVLDINSEALGVPAATLMEKAGKGISEHICGSHGPADILIVCGTGNNGGDGAVAARHLKTAGWNVTIALVRPRVNIKSQLLLQNLERLPEGVSVSEDAGIEILERFPIVLDCMLGTGLIDPPREPYASWINAMNDSSAMVISVDGPSGLGTPLAVKPAVTITMHDSKEGMTKENSGDIVVVDIGIPKGAVEYVGPGEFVHYPLPQKDSHKGQNGHLLIIGGGPYTGAPALSAFAALRGGVDLVWIAIPENIYEVVASYSPDFIVKSLAGDHLAPAHLPQLHEMAEETDAVIIGPGLGREEDAVKAVCQFVSEVEKPLVVDADGLFALSPIEDMTFKGPTVITPHRKEFERLTGGVPANEGTVSELAGKTGATVVLKAPEDIISDGERTKKNRTGNPAMSVGGTGDVLAGLIGALLAKGVGPYNAGRMGVYLNGRAGDVAFDIMGHSMTATEVTASIPLVLKDLLQML
jgi:NAD(P)H-hydrate epimerase